MSSLITLRLSSVALATALVLAACGGGSNDTVTAEPAGLGYVETAAVPDETSVLPFIDYAYTNQRGDARYATLDTNAGVRVVSGFLDLWTPSTLIVDAGTTAAANGSFPAVVASSWTGIPMDSTDGTIRNSTVLAANVQYVIDATTSRTAAQELAAYLDDRRGKGYSISDGMGPLTTAWRTAAQQTTSITSIASDATTVPYSDTGTNTGVGSGTNTTFGLVVDFVNNMGGSNASTEPAKRFFKYARPWRWSSSVVVVPALEPAKSATPGTDGGFISGHSAEATRDAIGMAYVAPQRYQEILLRALELGENRILAGMHSPLDVIGGRIQAQAVSAAALTTGTNGTATVRAAAYAQAQSALMTATGAGTFDALNTYAHSQTTTDDRFADHAANKTEYRRRLTYGFSQIGSTTKAATVPKGAEVLLETRQPYLSADQRRVVLKTTALPSGYPVLDDAEGWGRLNLFDAADGYGAFNGDVTVTMDASQGGFNALDTWRNDIAGAGKLTKKGTGTLALAGSNSYIGGTVVSGGALRADASGALGQGVVYVSSGTLISNASSAVRVGSTYTQLSGGSLQLNLGSGGAGRLTVSDKAALNGTLTIKFNSGYVPSAGDTLNVITAGSLTGTFTSITVDGHSATPTYSSTGLALKIVN